MEFMVRGKAQGRSGLGNFYRARQYKRKLQAVCIGECDQRDPDYQGEVALNIIDYVAFPMVAGISSQKKSASLADIAGLVKDALEQVAFKDGAQVVMMSLSRRYGDFPGLEVGISYLE